jgi:hypothetical protein
MFDQPWLRPLLLVITALAVGLTLLGVDSPVRVTTVLLYVVWVPGFAVVSRIGLTDPVLVAAVSIATSLSSCLLMAMLLLAVGWAPVFGFLVLATISTFMLLNGSKRSNEHDVEMGT